ncbi:MAG: endonuclease/exonuclease/phosphatase family protein [Sphingopyxis sp.]|nr:endonuclease/exonuclease/phosphatase family protein [Sphingopyxis sp.]
MNAGTPSLTVASYNMRKAVGLDRRRDPERILTVLHEIDADIVALQECDRRFGQRASAIPRLLFDTASDYRPVTIDTRPGSIGWHGNAILARKSLAVRGAGVIPLPTLEPRGAIWADIDTAIGPVRVIGMHLDISGLRRRQQARTICGHSMAQRPALPTIMMGDLNEWSLGGGCLRDFGAVGTVLEPGRSFHARRPMAMLDRIILSPALRSTATGVHHSALASRASDHLPVWATVTAA